MNSRIEKPIPYLFGFGDTVLAELGGVPLGVLHHDVDAICRCYDEIPALAERLGVKPPSPGLAGFCYPHVSALGAEVIFPPESEPNVHPMLTKPEQIDDLKEPDDSALRNRIFFAVRPSR